MAKATLTLTIEQEADSFPVKLEDKIPATVTLTLNEVMGQEAWSETHNVDTAGAAFTRAMALLSQSSGVPVLEISYEATTEEKS